MKHLTLSRRRLKKRDEIPHHIVSSHAWRALTGSNGGTAS